MKSHRRTATGSRRTTSLVLLALFVTYFATVAVFTHIHFQNGSIVVHAHLFNGTHSHSGAQADYWHNLTDISAPEAHHSLLLFPPHLNIFCLLGLPDCPTPAQPLTTGISLRAPPFLS